jgi:hypothetical protein
MIGKRDRALLCLGFAGAFRALRCGFQCIAATCYDLIAARLPI